MTVVSVKRPMFHKAKHGAPAGRSITAVLAGRPTSRFTLARRNSSIRGRNAAEGFFAPRPDENRKADFPKKDLGALRSE